MTDLYDAEPARFRRWTAAEYVDLTAEILRRLRPDIAVERIAGQTPPASAAGGRGATCAAMRCGGCSKKDSSKKTRIRANFSYLRSVNRSLS